MAVDVTDGEEARLAALYEYDVLDTAPEESFDRITRLVRSCLDTPMAAVSLVDRGRQWFKSRAGLDELETPRDISFCTETIRLNEPLIVPDALLDPRFRFSQIVTRSNVRFYAGVPLTTSAGHNIGALCAMDRVARQLSARDLAILQDLARIVIDELELRRLATMDGLTGVLTLRAFSRDAARALAAARRHAQPLACIMFDLDRFKGINDSFGHAAGDTVLRQIAALSLDEIRATDVLGRVGGEEFALALQPISAEDAAQMAERLRSRIAATPVVHGGATISVTASFGVTMLGEGDLDFESVRRRADWALYAAKSQGRNCVVCLEPFAPAVFAGVPAVA